MGISDKIESFISELIKMEQPDEWVELKRNELASIFNCVPSQINYVISTRFNTDHGYIVESRRGGGGYLKIKRINSDLENPIFSVIQLISDSIDFLTAKSHIVNLFNNGVINEQTAKVILFAISDNSLTIPQPQKDKLRANILKNTLASLI